MKVLLKNEVVIQLVFDLQFGTIKLYHVEGLMIQLIAVGILQLTGVKKDGSGLIVLAWEKSPLQQFNQDRLQMKGRIQIHYYIKQK